MIATEWPVLEIAHWLGLTKHHSSDSSHSSLRLDIRVSLSDFQEKYASLERSQVYNLLFEGESRLFAYLGYETHYLTPDLTAEQGTAVLHFLSFP
jgi:hypothetical protein